MSDLEHCVVNIARFQRAVWSVERGNFRPGDALAALEAAKVDADFATAQGAVGALREMLEASADLASWVEYDPDGMLGRWAAARERAQSIVGGQ
jgi:hypothetical protein